MRVVFLDKSDISVDVFDVENRAKEHARARESSFRAYSEKVEERSRVATCSGLYYKVGKYSVSP